MATNKKPGTPTSAKGNVKKVSISTAAIGLLTLGIASRKRNEKAKPKQSAKKSKPKKKK